MAKAGRQHAGTAHTRSGRRPAQPALPARPLARSRQSGTGAENPATPVGANRKCRGGTSPSRRSGLASAPVSTADPAVIAALAICGHPLHYVRQPDEPVDMRVEFDAAGQAQDVRPAGRLRYAAEAL